MHPSPHFASDNTAGIHPDVLAAIAAANTEHAVAYGSDVWTATAIDRFHEHFGPEAEVFFVFGGTGANVLGLQLLARPHEAIICADSAHIHADECGAPERFIGCKLLAVPSHDGKLRPTDIASQLKGIGNEHHVQPRVVSVTQATEYGTVYRPDELSALAEVARRHGLRLHMDGARLANAAASLGLPLRAITAEVGVDVLTFGGTKNGLLGAEAVVVFDPALARDFQYQRKQAMQLPSKMRFLGAQFAALLGDDLWRRNAEKANRMARLLADLAGQVPGVTITQPVEANAVFATVPRERLAALLEPFFFYVWDEPRTEVRWMASFDTTEEDVRAFARHLQAVLA
jgi:threonine aldolase